jgi:hypothetical protein
MVSGFVVLWRLSLRGKAGLFSFCSFTFLPFETAAKRAEFILCDHPKYDNGEALDRLDPVLPLSPGRAERHGFEYYRHGTRSLYAALYTSSGQVIGQTSARHTSAEFVAFLEALLARQPQEQSVHIICDNLSAHKTKTVCDFLTRHPKVRIHYTPVRNIPFRAVRP